MSKSGLATYGLIAAGFLFICGLLGYIAIKILLPEAIITSWWRSAEQSNKLHGGWDWHMIGWAWDITLPGNVVTHDLIKRASNIFPSVIVEKGDTIVYDVSQADHLHVALANKQLGVIGG